MGAVIFQGTAHVSSVAASARNLRVGLVQQICIVASGAEDARQITRLCEPLDRPDAHLVVFTNPSASDLSRFLDTSEFLSIVAPGTSPIGNTFERHVHAMERYPAAVMSFCPAGEGTPWPWPNSEVIDGRSAARDLLLIGRQRAVCPSAVLVRATATAPDDLVALAGDRSATLQSTEFLFLLELLTRGSAWCEAAPAWDERSEVESTREGSGTWIAAVKRAAVLELVDQPTLVGLLAAETRNVARSLRHPRPGIAVDTDLGLLDAIGDLVGTWRSCQSGEPFAPASIGTKDQSEAGAWMPTVRAPARPYALRKFIIAAPPYTESHGGVVALHHLCDRLNAAGYEAYIHPTGPTSEVRPGWMTPLQRGRSFNDAVIVYPEVISGNPFNAQRVVRWLLNRPGWFTGERIKPGADDLVVTFNRQIAPDLPVLSVPLIDPTVFFPKDHPGSGALLWIGKGAMPRWFDRSQVTVITRGWPSSRPALAAHLRSASVLYSCDWLTSLIDESLMCSTPVVLIGDQSWAPGEIELRPGMAMDDGPGLDQAGLDVTRYYPKYVEGLASTETDIEAFVELVNRHFDSLTS